MNKLVLTALACTALATGTATAQQNTLPVQQTTPPSTSQTAPGNTAATIAPRPDTAHDSSASYNTPSNSVGTAARMESKGAAVRSGGMAPMTDVNDKLANKANNAAINTRKGESRTAAAPVAGRNSFTESEARNRIEKFGYANVSGLNKDTNGVWRGTATKNGATADVALDYQGNIVMGK